ncbi:unnamed protein product [Rhizophagus irregularis]|nr:unnamed protein product [Rhizophagus irregularis]
MILYSRDLLLVPVVLEGFGKVNSFTRNPTSVWPLLPAFRCLAPICRNSLDHACSRPTLHVSVQVALCIPTGIRPLLPVSDVWKHSAEIPWIMRVQGLPYMMFSSIP